MSGKGQNVAATKPYDPDVGATWPFTNLGVWWHLLHLLVCKKPLEAVPAILGLESSLQAENTHPRPPHDFVEVRGREEETHESFRATPTRAKLLGVSFLLLELHQCGGSCLGGRGDAWEAALPSPSRSTQ